MDTPPCKGAFRAPYVRVDRRTFKTESEHDEQFEPWRSKGRNHRSWEGGICRDFDDEDWFIEIDDVISFVREHELCVIGLWYCNPEIMFIEIYDDYRE